MNLRVTIFVPIPRPHRKLPQIILTILPRGVKFSVQSRPNRQTRLNRHCVSVNPSSIFSENYILSKFIYWQLYFLLSNYIAVFSISQTLNLGAVFAHSLTQCAEKWDIPNRVVILHEFLNLSLWLILIYNLIELCAEAPKSGNFDKIKRFNSWFNPKKHLKKIEIVVKIAQRHFRLKPEVNFSEPVAYVTLTALPD